MIASATDYGPFAPVVGYGAAIMAAGAALFFMWGGKMEKWRPPDEDLPGAAQKIILLLCGVAMVLQWYLAEPNIIAKYLGGVALLAVGCVGSFMRYNGLLGEYVYIKKVATSPRSTKDVRILGGRTLEPNAEANRKAHGVDIQTLFEGAAFNVDALWSRASRRWVKQRVILYFILTLVLGTSALTGAGFATQVILSHKAAASVIKTSDAPGLEKQQIDVPGTESNKKE